jgi:hypothetical protein
MYTVDRKDEVIRLPEVPQSSVGAPIPVLLSREGRTLLAYYLENTPQDWDGASVRVVSGYSEEPLVIVEFKHCYGYMFGPPDDETYVGHPLADRGLKPYEAHEVKILLGYAGWSESILFTNTISQRDSCEGDTSFFLFMIHFLSALRTSFK